MSFERNLASFFKMDDEAWRRHANPWSGWTRVPVLPLLALAVWSRVWWGWWAAVPTGLLLFWTWVNPHLFPPPTSIDNWMSKGVLGERVWVNRDEISVPEHHKTVPHVLSSLSAIGMVIAIWGVWALDVWAAIFGTTVSVLGKLWFVDRMVLLYEEMKDAAVEYGRWSSS